MEWSILSLRYNVYRYDINEEKNDDNAAAVDNDNLTNEFDADKMIENYKQKMDRKIPKKTNRIQSQVAILKDNKLEEFPKSKTIISNEKVELCKIGKKWYNKNQLEVRTSNTIVKSSDSGIWINALFLKIIAQPPTDFPLIDIHFEFDSEDSFNGLRTLLEKQKIVFNAEIRNDSNVWTKKNRSKRSKTNKR